MTKDEKIEYLRGQLTYRANCPCCDQNETCAEGCTFAEDCPDGYADMQYAREVLEKTK